MFPQLVTNIFFITSATFGPISSEGEDLINISNLESVPSVVKENTPVILELRGLLKYFFFFPF